MPKVKNFILPFICYFLLSNLGYLLGGNDPCSSTILDPSTSTFDQYSNAGNTDSGITAPPYGGYSGSDIWFSFIMPTSGIANLIIKEGGMTNPAIAIYEGPCGNPKLLYNILDNNCNGDISPSAVLNNLMPGSEYFIRIWAENGSGDGSFLLFLSETTASTPKFLLHSDATQQGDCIQLTSSTNGQHGCAWFEIPIDFTQPFIHTMTANFGTNDATGADGICLIYQSNGPDYCGASGGGIGAEGMPNSAIFEFDTWQNGNFNDPFADHCAFNINGDMNHANSINGPISLPNIEDGADHIITFVWDGSTGYELYFDGVLVLSGSYDFINNLFGGSNTAWWGYTASTGGSNNNQSICPSIENYELGSQEYQEVTICEGESFNGYSETGFYVDFNGGSGNCLHQINTNLIVNTIPDPVFIDATICEGEQYYIGGNFLFEPGEYSIYLQSFLGCDSLVIVTLEVIKSTIELFASGTVLDCNTDSILLTSNLNTNVTDYEVTYNWSSNGDESTDSTWLVTQAGIYNLDITLEYKGKKCYYNDAKTIFIDTISPQIIGLNDVVLSCDTFNNINFLDASLSTPKGDLLFTWSISDSIIGNQKTQDIIEPGTYQLTIKNNKNGCIAIDTSNVSLSDDRPRIEIIPENLDCQKKNFEIQIKQDTQSVTYLWTLKGNFLSNERNPTISQGGEYLVIVTNDKGCQSKATVTITQDTIKPDVIISDKIIPCNVNQIVMDEYKSDSTWIQSWTQSLDFNSQGLPILKDEGLYMLNTLDTTNHCRTETVFYVTKLGNSPRVNIETDTLDCTILSFSPKVTFDQPNMTYEWTYQNNIVSNDLNYSVEYPGVYYLDSKSETGCVSKDTLIVVQDTIAPTISISKPDTIDCDAKTINLQSAITQANQIIWSGPQPLSQDQPSQLINTPGIYHIQAINSQNGCETLDSIEVISKVFIPIYSLGVDTINCNQPLINLPFTITSSYENIIWSGPNNFNSTLIAPQISYGGVYNLYIDVEGSCDIDTSIFIEEDLIKPTVDIMTTDITCDNRESSVIITLGANTQSWEWIAPNATISNKSEFNITEAGFQYLTTIGNNGCKKTDTIQILAFLDLPMSVVEKSGDITCDTTEIKITSIPDSSNINHTWILPDGSTINTPVIKSSLGGNYSLKIKNQYGCENYYAINVESHTDMPTFLLEHGNLDCKHNKTTITAYSEDLDISTIRWEGPNNFTSAVLNDTVSVSGNYTFRALNVYGCEFEDSLVVKELIEYSDVSLLSPDTLIIDSDNIQGSFEVDVVSDLDYSLHWLPAEGLTCYDCENPEITEGYALSYTLTIENEYGCQSQITTNIREKEKPVDIYIPNIISVDGNNINDGFTLYGNVDKIAYIKSLLIFDRWGNKVFEGRQLPINEPTMGWRGQFNGIKVEQGVYIYFASVKLLTGKEQQYQGDITVIR